MKKHYIQAVLDMIKEGNEPDKVISGLAALLKAKGHESLFGSVLRGVLRVLEAESDRNGAVVAVANKADAQKQVDAIKAALKGMGAVDDYTVTEDNTLIGGFIAEVNNSRHDASYKTALIKLYRQITK